MAGKPHWAYSPLPSSDGSWSAQEADAIERDDERAADDRYTADRAVVLAGLTTALRPRIRRGETQARAIERVRADIETLIRRVAHDEFLISHEQFDAQFITDYGVDAYRKTFETAVRLTRGKSH